MDKHLIKAITWNSMATLITLSVSYVLTGTVELSLTIAITERLFKIGAYYLHERAWE